MGVPVEMDGQTFDPETAGGRTLPESLEGEGSGLRLSQALLRFFTSSEVPIIRTIQKPGSPGTFMNFDR